MLEVDLVEGPEWGVDIQVAVKGNGKAGSWRQVVILQSSLGEEESMQRWYAYKETSTDIMEPVVVGPGRTRGEEEILLAKGI